jgi:hypothetical protein
MAQSKTTRSLDTATGLPRQSEQDRIALALRRAASHARKQLAAEGYKLPTQNWTGGPVRNPAV